MIQFTVYHRGGSVIMGTKKNSQKKKLTPEMRKRRNAARARLASMLGVAALCAAVIILVKIGSGAETPLEINAADYECLAPQTELVTVGTAEDGTPVLASAPIEEENTPAVDPVMAEVAAITPKLKDTYPIDMIIRSQYAIVYDVEADEVLYAKMLRKNAILPARLRY